MSGLSTVQVVPGKDVVQQLAAYIVQARGKPSSSLSRSAAFKCVLDAVACAAAGIKDSGPVAITTVAVNNQRPGDIPIWFTGRRSSAIGAAWANSAAVAAIDLDDGNAYARGHPGAAVVPTALAYAQEAGASFEDFLTAIVIGYEVGVVVGTARLTYGNTGTWSTYAAVATAAALRQTSREQIEHALGICGESAPNQLFMSARSKDPVPEGSNVKEGIPWSVMTGLQALDLAEAGHTGPRNVLDSTIHYAYPDELELGSARVCQTYFKPYACCRHIHAAIAGLGEMLSIHDLDVHSVERIVVETSHWAVTLPNKTSPQNLSDIQYSVPYCLALIALVGKEAFVPLTSEALFRENVTALAEKVVVTLADDMPKETATMETPARVTITVRGHDFVSGRMEAEGGVNTSPSWEEIKEKLIIATRLVAGHDQQDGMLGALEDFRNGDLAGLMDCLGGLRLVGSD
jgi:2-methylcitrate dehydratase PrpD